MRDSDARKYGYLRYTARITEEDVERHKQLLELEAQKKRNQEQEKYSIAVRQPDEKLEKKANAPIANKPVRVNI